MTESTLDTGLVAEAAAQLVTARETGVPCPPVRRLIGATDIAHAYAVQQRVNQSRIDAGARIVGRKAGLTSKVVQEQLGVDQPDLGVLFDDMAYDAGSTVPVGASASPM